MGTTSQGTSGESAGQSGIAEDVRAGLTSTPKELPPRLFYDARGSELFERIEGSRPQ